MTFKIAYSRNTESDLHYKRLKDLVNQRIKSLPNRRKRWLKILAFVLPLSYFTLYIAALWHVASIPAFYFLYSCMGFVLVLTFLSVLHESVHGNLFKHSAIDKILIMFMDLAGANSYIWKKRHIIMHHNYPNIAGWDTDIQQAGIIKIYPHGSPGRFQRFQHYFFILLYPMYLINWVLIRDFKDFFSKKQLIKKVITIPRKEYVKLIFFKTIYIFYILVIPILIGLPVLHAVMAVFTMLVLSGVFALVSLLTPHANIQNAFPLPDNNQSIKSGWFYHQLNTTNDITVNNWITKNLMGNFNYHLAHHLFPNISCVYAPEVTRIIRDYANNNGLRYRSYPFFSALKYHFLLLKSNAEKEDIFEETM